MATSTPTLSGLPLTNPATSDNPGGSTPIYTFSSGLVQISGIASLLGGDGLSEMAIGLKAAPGLAWASISCFGILKVVRAFLAGSIPKDTWRDALGLRTGIADEALGFGVWSDVSSPKTSVAARNTVRLAMQQRESRLAEQRAGIWLNAVNGRADEIVQTTTTKAANRQFLEEKLTGWNSLIGHNRLLRHTLAVTSTFGDEKRIQVHFYIPDTTGHNFQLVDWLLIAASALKASEAILLYHLGSSYLWWSGMIGYACCLVSAIVLQALNLGRDTQMNLTRTGDYLIGTLPSYMRIGSIDKQIILGQPLSVRTKPLWRWAWAAGAIINVLGVGITFYVLVKELEESTYLVYIWICFQILWVLLRTLVYHIIPDSNGALNVSLALQPLEFISSSSQARVLRLLLAASILQTQEHVRIREAYFEDTQSVSSPGQLIQLLRDANWQITEALPDQVQRTLTGITIEAIIGEHTLRTFVWITCAKINNVDIYDAVAVLFHASSGERYLVPGVRVMATRPTKPIVQDPEAVVPCFDQRGTINKDKTGYWVYWFPMQDNNWLEIRCDPLSVLGSLRGYRVLTTTALNKELDAGILGISLRGIEDLSSALGASRSSSHLLIKTIKGLRVSDAM